MKETRPMIAWAGAGVFGKGPNFLGDGNVLHLDKSVGYTDVQICQN